MLHLYKVSINYKALLKQLLLIFIAILIGTIFDWFIHQTSRSFTVPTEYFPNKIIFGTFWGFVAFKILRNYVKVKNLNHIAFYMSLFVAVILQTKYFLQGYELYFVFFFMFVHFWCFFLPTVILFRRVLRR